MTMNLVKSWDKQADALAADKDAFHVEGHTLLACPHNAARFVKAVSSAFLDAGYMPFAMVLGTVVQPVLKQATGAQCKRCISDALLAVPGVAERFGEPTAQAEEGGE